MRKITGERVHEHVNCDVTLLGISWTDGQHLQLSLGLPVSGHGTLDCIWVSNVGISIELGIGPPFTWEVLYERVESNRWRITFDFASRGNLTFECSDFELHIDDRRLQGEARHLLDDLCRRLDFCLPPKAIARLVQDPPPHVAAFTDAMFEAMEIDPAADRNLHRQVHTMVQAAFRRARVEDAQRSDEGDAE